MASSTDPSAPRTWVAIDIAKGWNVALVEHADGRQQRFRFRHCCEDYDGLVGLLRAAAGVLNMFRNGKDYVRTWLLIPSVRSNWGWISPSVMILLEVFVWKWGIVTY